MVHDHLGGIGVHFDHAQRGLIVEPRPGRSGVHTHLTE
ncbi:hypothetical protein BN2537_8115 [Streptomyces venezuelae]|nr:hypothetical protein BN2537_8115 [Streptomyces venezuelae]